MSAVRDDPTARRLDERILAVVAAWREGGHDLGDPAFDALALDLFEYQVATNGSYGRFVRAQAGERPASWREIPAVPAAAFKDAALATFDPRDAELEFHTSGTTATTAGKHYMEHAALYRAALLAGFDHFMLPDGARLRYLNLVPDAARHPHSSLGYMMATVGAERGLHAPGFYLRDDALDTAAFCADFDAAVAVGTPLCIAGTAFAFVALLDALDAERCVLAAPAGSRIMETGGFKGRSRVVAQPELYRRLALALGIPEQHIVAEYGMTELTSQYYDSLASRSGPRRCKLGPPWLRALVVDADGREVPPGEIGFLRHFDLANRSSVVAVQTQDRGFATDDGFVLLGRDLEEPLRGCSLDAEELATRVG
jgi:hypothetical protein